VVFWVLLGGLVENEKVGECGKEEVNDDTEDPEICVLADYSRCQRGGVARREVA